MFMHNMFIIAQLDKWHCLFSCLVSVYSDDFTEDLVLSQESLRVLVDQKHEGKPSVV